MAAQPSGHSASKRTRAPTQEDTDIGNFKKGEEIGKGSFATVYKGIHKQTGGYVAIKSVQLSKLNKKLKDNLFGEIRILQGLHHPHIVSLLDCTETATNIHLVMEYCQLGDLSLFIKKRGELARNAYTADMIKKYPNPSVGGLNEVTVRHFLQQLASALEFLRNRNLIHRDVKPQNLLLIPSPLYYSRSKHEVLPFMPTDNSLVPVAGLESLPMLKIADFGFARSLPATSLAETLCGSPLYMAPEILRYEKYDAKADLWSVGTVLYEMMVAKPPFRAANHVDLLRKIEKGEDKIKFPEDVIISDSMKRLIKALLKRNPVERMGFNDFFDSTVVKGEIPDLVGEDRPSKLPKQPSGNSTTEPMARQRSNPQKEKPEQSDTRIRREANAPTSNPTQDHSSRAHRSNDVKHLSTGTRESATASTKPAALHRRLTSNEVGSGEIYHDAQEHAPRTRRPSMMTNATAPARQDLYAGTVARNVVGTATQTHQNRTSPSPSSLPSKETSYGREPIARRLENKDTRELREAQERAAQDVAFERDYVVVEKRAVEVNAFADELAASPRIHGAGQTQQHPQHGTMVRRATTQPTSSSPVGANVTPSRALQIASGRRPEHQRQTSYERRTRNSTSASSAISKAINLASGRLFNFGITPPLGIGRGGPSPPTYSPFPTYPTNQGSLIMIGDGSKAGVPLDEDSKAIHVIEESATRSDVVYGFAEVKYKQLIPLAPSVDQGLGLRQAGIPERDESGSMVEDGGLTVDAIVVLSEEALVLYVKALFLLARSMDVAGAWWAKKDSGEVVEQSVSPKSQPGSAPGVAAGNRVNNVVQWVRGRFNEVLEKAEFVRLKLIEAQKRLPLDHPSHPANRISASTSTTSMGTSADNVIVSTGVTAERLMYLRALEMSKSAAINELVNEDLPGCEIAYITAIRMLEAVLENDNESGPRKPLAENEQPSKDVQETDFNIVNPDDRDSVLRMVHSIRCRLSMLRKKMHIKAKRNSAAAAMPPPAKPSVTTSPSQTPAVVGTPPR